MWVKSMSCQACEAMGDAKGEDWERGAWRLTVAEQQQHGCQPSGRKCAWAGGSQWGRPTPRGPSEI